MNLVHAIVILLSFHQITETLQRQLTASSGSSGGGARGGGGSSVSSSSRASGSSSSTSRAGATTTTRTVTSASQSRFSSGLGKYNGPVSATNLASGTRAVFVPTGNNYFVWFFLVNGDVEEYGNENDDVAIDENDLPPGCTMANGTSTSTNGTATYDQQYLEQSHTYMIDDFEITCGPIDITLADGEESSSLSAGAIIGIVVGSIIGFIILVAFVCLLCDCLSGTLSACHRSFLLISIVS